ncbi:hypothetical protein ACTXT7_006248, partial [Hymenolepis weldensis]
CVLVEFYPLLSFESTFISQMGDVMYEVTRQEESLEYTLTSQTIHMIDDVRKAEE